MLQNHPGFALEQPDSRIISALEPLTDDCYLPKLLMTNGIQVIIAGAGGAAHLPGMIAAHTCLPVLGVPVETAALKGMDSLFSIVQMPGGIPVGTLAIGKAGAKNAGLLAAQILALMIQSLQDRLNKWRAAQTDAVRNDLTCQD